MPHLLFQILQESCIHSNRTDFTVGKNKAKAGLIALYTQFYQTLSVFIGRKLFPDTDIETPVQWVEN